MELMLDRTESGAQAVVVSQPNPLQPNLLPPNLIDGKLHQAGTDAGVALAGDWAAYRYQCAFLDTVGTLSAGQSVAARRGHALAYLGRRAQLHGGVFRASRPTVFTEAVVAAMAKRNAATRFARYPWLAEMLALIAALDNAQQSVMRREANVLSFPDGSNSRA